MNGKYVVKIGHFYYKNALRGLSSLDVSLTYDVSRAGIFNYEEHAKKTAKKYGGKVVKVHIELEEV